MANTELAKKIMRAITEKPDQWDQHRWAAIQPEPNVEIVDGTCGTTMCLAGWACFLSGEKINWRTAEAEGSQLVAHHLENGRSIEDRAVELLDIDWDDANALFYAYDEDTAKDHLQQVIDHGEVIDPYRVEESY